GHSHPGRDGHRPGRARAQTARRQADGAVRLRGARGHAAGRHRAPGRQPAVPARGARRAGDGGAHALASAARPAGGRRLRPGDAGPAAGDAEWGWPVMTLLAALAGAAIAGGLALLIRELIGRVPQPGVPRSRRRLAAPSSRGRQALLALAACLLTLAITRWPVAGLAAALAVIFLPRVLTTAGQRQRTARLEALEQWT